MLYIINPNSSDLDLDAEAPPAKKSRVEEETDFSMASLAKGEVTQVSTIVNKLNLVHSVFIVLNSWCIVLLLYAHVILSP